MTDPIADYGKKKNDKIKGGQERVSKFEQFQKQEPFSNAMQMCPTR